MESEFAKVPPPTGDGVDSVAIYNKATELARWGDRKLSQQQRYQMARLTVAYGLDPFLNHVEMLGDNLYITVAGLMHNAAKSGELDGIETAPIVGEDAESLISALHLPQDAICFKALVFKRGCGHAFTGYGIASKQDVSTQISKSSRNIAAMAENRAVARALRKAFSVGMTALEEIDNAPSQSSEAQTVAAIDSAQADGDTAAMLNELARVEGITTAQARAMLQRDFDGDIDAAALHVERVKNEKQIQPEQTQDI